MPSPTPYDNLADIHRQLDEAQRHFNALEMRPRESLRDFEYGGQSLRWQGSAVCDVPRNCNSCGGRTLNGRRTEFW